jgi:hypothetical protein
MGSAKIPFFSKNGNLSDIFYPPLYLSVDTATPSVRGLFFVSLIEGD